MSRARHARKRSGMKLVAMIAALTLVFCCVVGGTVAWLTSETAPVVNTFTYGDIDIALTETNTNEDHDDNPNTNEYPMIPGRSITKDPTVTVFADSEDAWLFVKLEESENFGTFMAYEIADGWTALDGTESVYYRETVKSAQDMIFEVIKDNTVTVKSDVTKEMLNALDDGNIPDYPTLTVTAYAVQRDDKISAAAEAWALVSSN